MTTEQTNVSSKPRTHEDKDKEIDALRRGVELLEKNLLAAGDTVSAIGSDAASKFVAAKNDAKTAQELRAALLDALASAEKRIAELKQLEVLPPPVVMSKSALIWTGVLTALFTAGGGVVVGAAAYRRGRERGIKEVVDAKLEYTLGGTPEAPMIHMSMNAPQADAA